MARGKKTGGGSRKGIPNKHPRPFRDQLRLYCESINVDPHRFMADMIADQALLDRPDLRFNAAKELAQYLEAKLRAVEHTGEVTHTVRVIKHRYGKSD